MNKLRKIAISLIPLSGLMAAETAMAVGKLAARRRAIQLQQYLAEESNTDLNLPGYKGLTLNRFDEIDLSFITNNHKAFYYPFDVNTL